MGLFSNIVKTVKSSVVGKALDTLSAAFIAPISTAQAIFSKKSSLSDVIKKVEAKPLSEKITSTLFSTAVAATALYGGAAVAAGRGASVAASLIPKTLVGKAVAVVAVPLAFGAVVSKPQILQELPKIPAQIFEISRGIVGGKGIIDTIKNNPVGAVVLGGAAALLFGKAAGAVGSAIVARNVLEEDTKNVKSPETILKTPEADVKIPEADVISGIPVNSNVDGKVLKTDNQQIELPPTQTISTGKPRRRARIKNNSSVNQNVRVIVSNTAQSVGIRNQKYLNRAKLYN